MAESSDIYHDGRVLKEAESLAERNYDLKVFGFRNNWQENKKFDFSICTFYIFPRKLRLLRNISIAINIILINILILFIKADYYHAHNTMFLFSSYISSKLYGGKFIYDSHEVQWELNKIARRLEKIFIHKVDMVINVSKGRAKIQAKKYGIPLSKIIVIANYPKLLINKSYNIKQFEADQLHFIFSGDFNLNSNPLDNFILALKQFRNVNFSLLAKDNGKDFNKLRKIIAESNLSERIKFLPLVSPDELIDFLSQYDFGVDLLINPNNLISRNYHGINKIYEYLAAGLPILCSDLPSFQQELVGEGAGICVNPKEIDSIKSGIEFFIKNYDKVIVMKKKALKLATTKYNWNTQQIKLIKLYENLL